MHFFANRLDGIDDGVDPEDSSAVGQEGADVVLKQVPDPVELHHRLWLLLQPKLVKLHVEVRVKVVKVAEGGPGPWVGDVVHLSLGRPFVEQLVRHQGDVDANHRKRVTATKTPRKKSEQKKTYVFDLKTPKRNQKAKLRMQSPLATLKGLSSISSKALFGGPCVPYLRASPVLRVVGVGQDVAGRRVDVAGKVEEIFEPQHAHPSKVRFGVRPLEPDVLPLLGNPGLQGRSVRIQRAPQRHQLFFVVRIVGIVRSRFQGLHLLAEASITPDLPEAPAQRLDEPRQGGERIIVVVSITDTINI